MKDTLDGDGKAWSESFRRLKLSDLEIRRL